MYRYKKEDIVICATEKMHGMTTCLKVGKKYIIDDFFEMMERTIVGVKNHDSGEYLGVFDDKYFIHLNVWREFQLKKVI